MEETVRVPSARIAALIGKEGKTKRKIEKLTKCRIKVDSKTGEATIEAEAGGKNFYNALNIIRAIARGFSPEKALLLLDEDYLLEILKLEDFLHKKKFKTKKIQQKSERKIERKKTSCKMRRIEGEGSDGIVGSAIPARRL